MNSQEADREGAGGGSAAERLGEFQGEAGLGERAPPAAFCCKAACPWKAAACRWPLGTADKLYTLQEPDQKDTLEPGGQTSFSFSIPPVPFTDKI